MFMCVVSKYETVESTNEQLYWGTEYFTVKK